jgi:hypothetical protein
VNLGGIEDVVADKGYHSGAVVEWAKSYQVRTYIRAKAERTTALGRQARAAAGSCLSHCCKL